MKYNNRRITSATITRPVMGALSTPIMRIERSIMQSQNSRSKRLQHPLLLGACSLLSNPLLVRTISVLLLLSLAKMLLETSAEPGGQLTSGRRSVLAISSSVRDGLKFVCCFFVVALICFVSAFVFGYDCYLLCICFEDRLGMERKERNACWIYWLGQVSRKSCLRERFRNHFGTQVI